MVEQQMPLYIVWDKVFGQYNFGPTHPMHPLRLDLTARLCEDFGLFDLRNVTVHSASVATDELLETVHSSEYISAIRAAESTSSVDDAVRIRYGVGTDDVPRFDHIHEASARIVQGSVQAAQAIVSGEAVHAVNFSGGMHHARRDKASGFCVYNDVAAAITHLLDSGVQKVAYIDIDAHHGDGTESIFWDDPRVLTISLHETGRMLFPGTGFADEIGGSSAEASAVNVALPPRTSDSDWLRAFDAIVPPLIGAFEPEVIVSQHGCDGHLHDPLTHLRLSVDALRQAAIMIDELAAAHCGNRWLAVGGGGYDLLDAVPRSWAHLVAIAAGKPIAVTAQTPESWRDYVHERSQRDAPRLMGDEVELWWRSWKVGFDPNNELDRAVMATKKSVFPFHGLDPYFD
ncbi:acetoin utilization protein AcuC [Saxibacter everestensis]|uniref:Acetoin utilization protein AcuC n=1 Tax=Saxibacter everestensis TaxID=2909229 RepID=A0ABY8QPS9_9MICO|nr:acetoin utilization protein AcuC [Brevibacteriaceae bacterium ZFBP1038]